jgi:two-component system CheB/CheR fusion protein
MKPPRNSAGKGGDSGEQEEPRLTPVVAIGASAGGIDALKEFVPAISKDSGCAYVVVLHLDPDHSSVLASILGRGSPIPVTEITAETAIEPDHIYVMGPNTVLSISDDHLLISKPVQARGFRTPIDGFLTSLAPVKGEHCACVILSGTGSDGTVGLRAIKENGGLAIAQHGAEYDGMMRSAVGSGLVDFVLPVQQIPPKLDDYFRHLVDGKAAQNGEARLSEGGDYLAQIGALLRTRTGHDFSGYKDKTVARRVQRRMQVLQVDDVPAFIERLRKEPAEIDALLQDLLIGVTNFFRDPAAFEALEREVIPKIFEGKSADDSIRIWVPGCSTGEEAYSIGILLREYAMNRQGLPKLQIFASDIDESALQIARIGRYPASIGRDVPAKRLERYFVREDGTYRISSDLREICLFSAHNLLRDAPFSKLDLVSCRNLLIYLNPNLQNRLIPLFHYALNSGGYLFLGSSENVTRHSRLFGTIDKTHRIFQRRSQPERRLPEFPLTTPEDSRRRLPPITRPDGERETLQSIAEKQLIEHYAPAFVVINSDGDVLHASSRTGKYLELSPGVPRTDVFSLARPGLRAELRAGVHRAISSGAPVVQSGISIGTNGGRQAINLIVHPLRQSSAQDPLYIVAFQDLGGIKASGEGEERYLPEDAEGTNLHQLEAELQTTKERLQTTTEELESSNEELKSGNEELSSMNEELQSANEELETSKEELQSINEELQTVNTELNSRVDELSRANSDIANLLESTQIATVFLDRNLAIKSFTPAAKDVFRLVESDTGRPITHVRARFAADTVQEDAERVLRNLHTIEREIESTYNDSRYVMRVMPYRTVDNVIAGVVITFMDVTKINAAEERIEELTRDLKNRVQSLETLLDLVPAGIVIMEDSGSGAISLNRLAARMIGDDGKGHISRPSTTTEMRIVQDGRELAPAEQPLNRAVRSGETISSFEGEVIRPDGSRLPVLMSATPLLTETGKARGGIAVIIDISERKQGEAQQQILLHELQHRVKNILTTVSALALNMLKRSGSLEEFAGSFSGRLSAMARTHELLSAGNWQGAGLRPLVERTLAGYRSPDGRNLVVAGPDITLSPSAASTLGLVLYELATNAVKYGALSSEKGRIAIEWKVDPKQVHLSWTESDGPPVPPDASEGFGTSFIKRSIAYEMSGTADLELREAGLRCVIEFPLEPNVLGDRSEGRRRDHGPTRN